MGRVPLVPPMFMHDYKSPALLQCNAHCVRTTIGLLLFVADCIAPSWVGWGTKAKNEDAWLWPA
jgi:hypothetical protein